MAEFKRDLIATVADSARISLKELSISFKKPPAAIKYLLQTYIKSQILTCPHVVIDYSFFGLILFKVYFRGGYVGDADKEAIISTLNSMASVTSIYELSGEFDLVAEFECPNSSRFNKELRTLITQHPTLNNYKIALNIVTHLLPHQYLSPLPTRQIVIGGDKPVEYFDDLTKNILRQIVASPLSSVRELSRLTGHHPITVKKIISDLEKRKILRGYKYILNALPLNINKIRVFIRFHNISKDREKALHDFIFRTPEIIRYHKTIGDWDMELDVESLEKQAMRQIIMRLRGEFKDIIQTFNSVEFYAYYKKKYLPSGF